MKHQPVKQGQTTTPGTSCPTLCEKFVGSLTSPANQYREDAGDGTYGTKPKDHYIELSIIILIKLFIIC